ncbi:MAG TPA: O-acetylhomoserine aminocarboxypropyltransferase/cysteine synthase, partial [Spirochaetes bacterium]|nr:O-acetylhomoserine aminocarboxypropyltransferase/cysteine synthase [Spirochaetota bacterium]
LNMLRDLGPALSPFNAFLVLQGMETLHLRMARHSENALKVAGFLKNDPRVAWVNYPGLPDDSRHETARRYLAGGFGALVGFGIKGGLDAAVRFIDRLRLVSHLANIGDVRTLVIHPASTTHQQLSREDREREGIGDDFIRLCIGIEAADDIIDDINQALG